MYWMLVAHIPYPFITCFQDDCYIAWDVTFLTGTHVSIKIYDSKMAQAHCLFYVYSKMRPNLRKNLMDQNFATTKLAKYV